MKQLKHYYFFIITIALMALSPASQARYGGRVYSAAEFQQEVEQMVDVYESFRDNHPYRHNRRLNTIENQLDRLSGVAIRLTRNLRNGRLRRARVHKADARRIVRNTSRNLNAVNVSHRVRQQWRRVKNALNRVHIGGAGNYYGDNLVDDDEGIVGHGNYILDEDGDDEVIIAQPRPHASGNITGMVDQIEDLSERVKNTFRKTSKRRQSWEKTLDGQLSAFDQLANQLRDRWKSQHSASSIRATVNALVQKSASIHGIIARYPVNASVKSYWLRLKSQLDGLNGAI